MSPWTLMSIEKPINPYRGGPGWGWVLASPERPSQNPESTPEEALMTGFDAGHG